MDEVTLIDTVQSHLDSALSVPVRTRNGTEDDRPVPAVILDDIDITDIIVHNTHLSGVEENDSPGTPDKRYHSFRYWARFDYLIRHTSDREAAILHRDLKNVLRPLSENPRALHDHTNEVKLRGGGGFTSTNVEDQEAEMNFAFRIRTFHLMDNINDVGFSDSTLDTIQNALDSGDGEDFTVTN